MAKKKGKGGLPRVDRSRALPVRSGISFWRTLLIGGVVGGVVWFFNHDTPEAPPQVPTTITESK